MSSAAVVIGALRFKNAIGCSREFTLRVRVYKDSTVVFLPFLSPDQKVQGI